MATAQMRFSAADRREQILEIATDIFARRGFQGATTRHIAEKTGVTEAIIFRHFASKEELYWAVIERKIKSAVGAANIRESLNSGKPDLEILSEIATEILERRAKDHTLTRLLMYSALENHDLSYRFFQNYSVECFELLADYVRARIAAGRFRKVNALLAARGFFGMVVYHSWVQELYGAKRSQNFPVQEVGALYANLWLQGMLKDPQSIPDTNGAASKNGSPRKRKAKNGAADSGL